MQLVLLHFLMNAQPLHFPHMQIDTNDGYWHQRHMLQVMDSTKYSAHCSLFHFRAKKNPAQKLLLLSQQYKGMIKLVDFIVEYQLVACNYNVTIKVLIILQFERSREQRWSTSDRALASHQCDWSSILRVDAMSRPFWRGRGGGGAVCELAGGGGGGEVWACSPTPSPHPQQLRRSTF